MQGKLWDDDYEFKAECFSNCFWLWSRCPSRIHLKDPPKPHTLMMPQGIVTPRSECSEVFFVASATFAAAYNISVAPKEGEELLLENGDIEENPFMRPAKAVEIVTPGSKTIGIIDGDYSGNEAVNFAKDMVVDTIIFKRTFPVVAGGNNYSTIMFPFETKAEEVDSLDAVYMFLGMGVDKSNNKYVAVERVWYSRFLSESYTMEAYKPYLIKLKSNATNIVIKKKTDLVLKATPTEDGDFDVMQSDDYNKYGNYVFRGVVQGKTWDANSPEVLGTNKAAAYGFAGTATSDISVGQFVKVGEGAYIKPLRAYIYKSPVPQSVNSNGAYVLRQTASIDNDIPETMNVVVVDRKKDGEEQTTVIGQFNSRTGEIRLNHTKQTYDLKGRSVRDASHMAKGVYLKK